MSQELQGLRTEFDRYRKDTTKHIDEQAKAIKKLEAKVKDLEKEQSKLVVYVNNLMKKADTLIKNNYAALRRTQVIANQRITTLQDEVASILNKLRK